MSPFLQYTLRFLLITSVILFVFSFLMMSSGPVQVRKHLLTEKYLDLGLGKMSYKAIVRLFFNDRFFCTGIVISDHYVLTASHCVVDELGEIKDDLITVKDGTGLITSEKAIAAALNKHQDVALIKGDFSKFISSPVDFEGRALRVNYNQFVQACGYPGGGALFCTAGYLTGNKGFMLHGKCGLIEKGMSGGPVFDVKTGYIIGVNSSVCESGQLFGPVLGLDSVFGIR